MEVTSSAVPALVMVCGLGIKLVGVRVSGAFGFGVVPIQRAVRLTEFADPLNVSPAAGWRVDSPVEKMLESRS